MPITYSESNKRKIVDAKGSRNRSLEKIALPDLRPESRPSFGNNSALFVYQIDKANVAPGGVFYVPLLLKSS
jgi:hypothetical protein